MSSHRLARLLFMTSVAALLFARTASADPSGRVARISFTAGTVSFRPGTMDEWSVATLNYPLTMGDHLWTDAGARGELQLGATAVRVAPLTELSLLSLDDRTAQLRLTQGAVSVSVRAIDADDLLEIDTPAGAVSLLRPGLYRVDVSEGGDSTTVTVRHGEADVATAAADIPLQQNQSAALAERGNTPPTIQPAVPIDEFEDWCLTRDRRAEHLQAARYVSPETIGYEDLDANGSWQTAADYGPVWIPRVRAEWAPYRFGHWVWVDPWGWTWIDEAPWGFAPFHYGRWAFLPGRGWAWVPGTIVARPVYAPALVAFVGGAGWSTSVRVGSEPIGWFPLGPREVYVPAYRVTPFYLQRVNASHVVNVNVTNVNVTNVTYVNRNVPGAVTVVPRETFVRAQPVARAAIVVPREQIGAATVVGSAAPVAPQPASIGGAVTARAIPPPAAVTRQVVVRRTPPPPPALFAAKQRALEQHPGQPVEEPAARRDAPDRHPLVRAVAPARAPHAAIGQPAPAAKPSPAPPSAPAAQPAPPTQTTTPSAPPKPAAQPAPPPPGANAPNGQPRNPAPVPPSPANPPAAAAKELAARHAQERADMQTRHTQERQALQAKHQQERQAAPPAQRSELQQRHQQEMKVLQEKQQQEREAIQKRQQEERGKKEPR
jgi:uncharacterized protein DUF6600/FecR-like protein